MYDELISSLRICGDSLDAIDECCYEDCIYHESPIDPLCMQVLCNKAADAIKELQADKAALNGTVTNLLEQIKDLGKPKWIPVTERLPEKMQYVLARYQNNDMAVASWFGGDEHIRFWRAMTDEGWCADCDSEPTHWMPLPEPPKEE